MHEEEKRTLVKVERIDTKCNGKESELMNAANQAG
jgi:hypothetical protein